MHLHSIDITSGYRAEKVAYFQHTNMPRTRLMRRCNHLARSKTDLILTAPLKWLGILLSILVYTPPVFAQIPPAPSNLVAEVRGQDAIDLSWQNNATNAIGFNILRAEPGEPFELLGRSEVTLYEDRNSGLQPLTEYCYQVSAFNSAGTSAAVEACVTIPTLPSAPSDLSLTYESPNAVIRVQWQDNATDEIAFNIYRFFESGPTALLAEVPFNTQSYRDTDIRDDGTYCYFVRSQNTSGESSATTTVCQDVLIASPALPTNLMATPVSSEQVLLSWQLPIFNYRQLLIERGPEPEGPFEQVGTVEERSDSFLDDNLDPNTQYCYRIQAENVRGASEFSDAVCARTNFAVPPVPLNVQVVGFDTTSIEISWDAPSLSEHFFRIEQEAGDGNFVQLADNLTENSYISTDLNDAIVYCYRVQMVNPIFESAFSDISCGLVQARAPQNVQADPGPDPTSDLALTWQPGGTPGNLQFAIRHRTSGTEEWSDPAFASTPMYTLTGLHDGTRYDISIESIRTLGDFTARSAATMIQTQTFLSFWPGDTNNDGLVDANDVVQLTSPTCFGANTASVFDTDGSSVAWAQLAVNMQDVDAEIIRCDTDRNGHVEAFDFLAIAANVGRTTGARQETVTAIIASEAHRTRLLNLYQGFTPATDDAAAQQLKADLAALLGINTAELPDQLALHPVYPNPFRTQASVIFDLPEAQPVRLTVFNTLGQRLLVVEDGQVSAGRHTRSLSRQMLPPGVYFVVLETNAQSFTEKITVLN